MSASFRLQVVDGPNAGETFVISRPTTLGRQEGNDIVLRDEKLSRWHARFELGANGLTIVDLGAANGVTVNGQRIQGSAAIRPGDIISLGASRMRVVDGSGDTDRTVLDNAVGGVLPANQATVPHMPVIPTPAPSFTPPSNQDTAPFAPRPANPQAQQPTLSLPTVPSAPSAGFGAAPPAGFGAAPQAEFGAAPSAGFGAASAGQAAPPPIVPPAPTSPPAQPRRSSRAFVVIGALLLVLCIAIAGGLYATRGGLNTPATATVVAAASAVPAAAASASPTAVAASVAPSAAASASAASGAGMIVGRLTTAAGQPITASGATVAIDISGTTLAGQSARYQPNVDAQGRYAQQVADGSYTIAANVTVTYNGGTYTFPLAPNDNQPASRTYESKPGVTKDFTWKVQGAVPGGDPALASGYYGTALSMINTGSGTGTTEFTFALIGQLIDGSTTPDIKRTVTPTGEVFDVPIGRYVVSGTVRDAGGTTRPVQVCDGTAPTCTYAPQVVIDFKPASGGAASGPASISLNYNVPGTTPTATATAQPTTVPPPAATARPTTAVPTTPTARPATTTPTTTPTRGPTVQPTPTR